MQRILITVLFLTALTKNRTEFCSQYNFNCSQKTCKKSISNSTIYVLAQGLQFIKI